MEKILGAYKSGQAVLVASQDEISSLIEVVSNRFPKLKILGFFYAENGLDGSLTTDVTVLGALHDAYRYLDENDGITHVICSLDNIASHELQKLSLHCDKSGRQFLLVSGKLSDFHRLLKVDYVGDTVVVLPKACPMMSCFNKFVKRLVDLFVSLLILLTVFPVVYIYKAVRIKCGLGGSVFATVNRCNVEGIPFSLFCFRRNNGAEKGRIADNLPFLLSVFTGKMSLVGPLPLSKQDSEEYLQLLQNYHMRFSPKPGLIPCHGCLLKNIQTQSHDILAEQVRADVWYVEHWTLWVDVRLMLSCVLKMFI